MSKMPIK